MKVKDDWNDSRELLEKQMDAQDMTEEMQKDSWDSALEEIFVENQAVVEQLQSDLEDWKRKANDYKKQMQKAESRLAIGWFTYD